MATARLAMSYDREVMAFPGRPEDKYSAGCNFLIKENIAALTENATDVAHLLGYPIKKRHCNKRSYRISATTNKGIHSFSS